MPSKGAKRLKHSRDSKLRLTAKGVTPKSGPGSRPRWTEDEDLLIMAENFDVIMLSKKLDRTVDAIYVRRSKIARQEKKHGHKK